MKIKTLILGLSFVFAFSYQGIAQNIFEAIQKGDLEEVKSILTQNKDAINNQDKDKDTPLHYAAQLGNEEITELLISKGASLNTQNFQGYTPLHWAASKGHLMVVEILILHGADVHLKTQRGRTPLFLVAMNNGNASIARLLLDAGADVNSQENSGAILLSYAPFRGFNELIDVLLDYGAEVLTDTDLWNEVFHRACSIGHKRLAELMIEKGLDIHKKNEDGRLPLHSAAEGGSLDIIGFLIKKGNPVNCKDYCGASPLHLAAASGFADAVKQLIELGADIDARNSMGATPFNLASGKNHQKVMELLIEKGAITEAPQFPVIQGAYLGQKRPGKTPEIFGQGLVSAYAPIHGCVTFTSDGEEMYWSIVDFQKRGSTIYQMKIIDGKWTKPEIPAFTSDFSDDVPFVSPDGEKLYILSNRPVIEGAGNSKENIWVMERQADSWINAQTVGKAINKMDLHWQFSVANDGTIYFASSDGTGLGLNDIYLSKLVNGAYQKPQNLGEAINSKFADFAPYVSPDQSYIIFTSRGRPEGSGLFISFKKDDGNWTKAKYLGEPFGADALLTTISPNGKYLFFTGRREGRIGVFWVDAKIIEEPKYRN